MQGTETAVEPLRIERWPTEQLLLVLVGLASLAIWILLFVTVIGFVYAAMLGVFFFLTHLGFVAYVRGSGVRLGPDQFPDLHRRVLEISSRLGMKKVPEAYILQAGGALNALATTFLRSQIVVLYSDLLEACGDNEAARDMIVGHEMGHLRAGHLRWKWLILPGMLVPFLGAAYSRAREYTCDRYGAALCGDREGALLGLGILAAGGSHARKVNTRALARQQESLNTGWMTIGTWLGTHPPISERLSALEPALIEGTPPFVRGRLRAVIIIALLFAVPILGMALVLRKVIPEFRKALEQAAQTAGAPAPAGPPVVENVEEARAEAIRGMEALREVIERYHEDVGRLPPDATSVYDAWALTRPGQEEPEDPFDGERFGYSVSKGEWWLWSSGPDGQSGNDDDIWFDAEGVYE